MFRNISDEDVKNTFMRVADVLRGARLNVAAPFMYSTGIRLEMAAMALNYMNEGDARRFVTGDFMPLVIRQAEIIFRNLSEDPLLSNMLGQRIYDTQKIPARNTTVDYAAHIRELSVELKGLVAHLPQTKDEQPEEKQFAYLLGELSALKGRLATERRGSEYR